MEEYPEELRTPPVALISLVGCPEHHSTISTHLHSQQPPINVLALPDFSKIPVVLTRKSKEPGSGDPPAGIIKRNWLLKHRTKIPSLVAAMFSSIDVSGDPTQWLQVCTELENLKAAIRPRNVKLVVVVVLQTPSADDINEERMIALRKRAEIDTKFLLILNPNDASELKQSLDRLGSAFSELANTYYRDEGRKIKTRVEKKSFSSNELYIRYCFKVAVYAEFRRDWVEALRFYEDAYRILREAVGSPTKLPPIQRLVEVKTVAEQLQFKISTLLLHGGKIREAVIWFCQHNAAYKGLVGAPEVVFLHWEWMSKQFLVFAELLETSSATAQSISSSTVASFVRPLTEWEFRPAYYYQLAAQYLQKKRSSLDLSLSMSETNGESDSTIESVVPSLYVGQFARSLEQGDAITVQLLSDEEYTQYALAEGKRFQDSYEIIALLRKSYDSYINLKAQRMGAICGLEIAKEYFSVDDFNQAKQLFESVTDRYRQEGWVALLWEVLGYLRECSRKVASVKNFVEYSLEMAALPVSSTTNTMPRFIESGPAGPPTVAHREYIHKEVMGLICQGSIRSAEENNNLELTEENPLHLEIDVVSPLRTVMLASVAFHEQIMKPGASTLITLSLLSQLPLNVEIDQIEVHFNQSHCNFTVVNAERAASAVSTSGEQKTNSRVEISPSLALATNRWLRLTYDITSEQSGKLECISVVAKLGPHFTILCRAESPASMDGLPLWKFEDHMETYPIKDLALAFNGQKAIQVEEPEQLVDLSFGASGPALVGESFMVPVTIEAKGHNVNSGELKINLVDVKGGGLFSPREAEQSSFDSSHHVELVAIDGVESGDESGSSPENINKIQKSFGLVSVPFLKNGESWSCKLEIKWHRPKPIMLYISLGYSPNADDPNTQKIHLHESLQIEGKVAVSINHRILLPFRRDPLLLSRSKPLTESDQVTKLALNETSILIISARNCTEVPLQLESLSVVGEDDSASCRVKSGIGGESVGPCLLAAGKEFKKAFTVIPEVNTPTLGLGTVNLQWRRDPVSKEDSTNAVVTKHTLPDINVEQSPLVLSLECPPYAVLGDPFTYFVKIKNQTLLLQELKFSLSDSQSFVMAGCHTGSVFVLPKTEHILSYKVVPLCSGSQQLPKFTLTSVRYSMGFQPSFAASSIFVFPSKPQFKVSHAEDNRALESVEAK